MNKLLGFGRVTPATQAILLDGLEIKCNELEREIRKLTEIQRVVPTIERDRQLRSKLATLAGYRNRIIEERGTNGSNT